MNKPFKPSEELISLNEELHTEFAIVELEQRLETDPLMLADMMARGLCDVAGALSLCSGGSTLNYCENDGALNVTCTGKFKENDNDFCNPICDRVVV